MKKGFPLLVAALLFASCGSNTDDEGFTPVPIEPLATINEQNEAELVSFLQSHYYDVAEAIRPLSEAPDKTLALWDDPRLNVKQVKVRPSEHNLDTEGYTEDEIANGIPHNLYYFLVQEGSGN